MEITIKTSNSSELLTYCDACCSEELATRNFQLFTLKFQEQVRAKVSEFTVTNCKWNRRIKGPAFSWMSTSKSLNIPWIVYVQKELWKPDDMYGSWDGQTILDSRGLDCGGLAKSYDLFKAENCILTGVRESDGWRKKLIQTSKSQAWEGSNLSLLTLKMEERNHKPRWGDLCIPGRYLVDSQQRNRFLSPTTARM